MKKTIITLLLGGLFITGCVPQQVAVDNGPIKLGVATLLTGDFAVAGENMVKAVELAVEEINNSGGIDGQPLQIIVEDAQCDSAGGLNAAQKLINVDKVKYIVGGTCSNGTLAAAPLANKNQVVYLTPVTGGRNVDEAGEYIFRTANSDVLAGRDIANAMIDLGYYNVGVISEVTEYTLDIKNTFEEVIKDRGGNIVISEQFVPGTKDYRTQISKIKAAQPEAILVLSQLGTNAAYFIKQSRELSLETPLFTDFTLIVNNNAKEIAGSFDGIYFADPAYDSSSPEWNAFLDRYSQTYNLDPVIPFHAAASYDAVMMIVDAIKEVGDDSQKVHDWLLSNVKNRTGLMGTYSLDENGNSDLGFVIKLVEGDNFVEIK